jgi:hypothetical protein
MRKLVLNYQGFRGKFHILEVTLGNDDGECAVAKQIQNRIGFRWGSVSLIDHSQDFKEAPVAAAQIECLFIAADAIQVPRDRKPLRGKDGMWYSLQLGEQIGRRVVSWWSDKEPELQPLYDLRNEIVAIVMKSIRSSTKA